MNKALFEKVKAKTTDNGLSEKYLKAITERLGGSIEDDSTDENAIEAAANQIVAIAQETQAEATRWASKKNDQGDQGNQQKTQKQQQQQQQTSQDDTYKAMEDRLKKLEEQLAESAAKSAKETRAKEIADTMAKHNIPDEFRERLAKSIDDNENADEVVAAYRQSLITRGLMPSDAEGSKAASTQQVDKAADSLLESIQVK